MDLELTGRRALVTGASTGIGLAIVRAFAAEGCAVVLVARNEAKLRTIEAELRTVFDVDVQVIAADLSKPDDQLRVAAEVGEIDILVNNAGANPGGEIDTVTDELWRASWDVKVFGYINLIRALYPRMKTQGHGVIVNVIGNAGERMNARYVLGSSGNAALMALTKALGGRSPDVGVRVVGVNPGITNTDRAGFLLRGWSESKFGTPNRIDEVLSDMDIPFGRMAEPGEIADAVLFLASPRAAYISGTILTVDGGAAHRN